MTQVKALTGFDHAGRRRKDDEFEVSPNVAKQLEQRRLVEIIGEPESSVPSDAVGEPSSASPAAQVSVPTTPQPSASGATAPPAKKAAKKVAKKTARSRKADAE